MSKHAAFAHGGHNSVRQLKILGSGVDYLDEKLAAGARDCRRLPIMFSSLDRLEAATQGPSLPPLFVTHFVCVTSYRFLLHSKVFLCLFTLVLFQASLDLQSINRLAATTVVMELGFFQCRSPVHSVYLNCRVRVFVEQSHCICCSFDALRPRPN